MRVRVSTRDARVPVLVEVMLLAADGGQLTYRAVHRRLTARAEPDAVAKTAWAPPADCRDGLLHSTSWRHEAGEVVLTYVAIPDRRAPACPVYAHRGWRGPRWSRRTGPHR